MLEKEYEELGKEDLEITDVYNHIKSYLNLSELTSYKKVNIYDSINYNNCIFIIQKIIDNCNCYKTNIKARISDKIKLIFEENNILKLNRFNLFRKYIIYKYNKIIDKELAHLNIWVVNYINKFKYELTDNTRKLIRFESKLDFNFKRYILRNLELFEIKDNELLIENDEWKLKRNNLKEEIKKYKNCKCIIENL